MPEPRAPRLRAGLLTSAELPRHPAWEAGHLLDVRPAAEFAIGHAAPAASLPLAAADLDRLPAALPSALLPPRASPLVVIAGDAGAALAVRDELRRRGRPADACVLDGAALAPGGAAAGWPEGGLAQGASRHRLWRPPRLLVEQAALLPPPAAGAAVDLGAGSGRAAVWLAENGYRVTAVDRLPDALALARRVAEVHGVPLELLRRDLRDPAQVPGGPWAVVLMMRFLHRPLLARLPSLLQPGGVALVQGHLAGATSSAGASTRLLPRGELGRLLATAGLEVLAQSEEDSETGGRLAGAVARRPDA